MAFGKIRIDEADKYFSLYIRTRDRWICQRCLTQYKPPTNALHCSHFAGRGKEATRFDPRNATALCYGCHQYFTSHPQEHYLWQVERMGQKEVDALILASNLYHKKDRLAEKMYWKQKYNKLIKDSI